ncbi:MAG: DUF1836 domain-containing protein [Clostridia bacterium]|nr:DUF1836 domain-containing protein [Clostridia bacterium]
MGYDTSLVAGKLRRWEFYLDRFRLPAWNQIPDFGLYMEQLILLLKDYLDYLPPELKEEQFITASTINNYVRTHVMPEPVKKRYYRVHIAYIIIILTLKQSLSIALIQKIIPMGLTDEEVEHTYTVYAQRHSQAAAYFMEQVRSAAGPILGHSDSVDGAVSDPAELIALSAIISGFSRLMAEKLLLLEGKDLSTGGSIALKGLHHDSRTNEAK